MSENHRRFEELPVWQDARKLCHQVYSVCKTPAFRADADLVSQIRRAAVSVLSNIAEGMERGSNDELIAFLFYAKGSSGEVRAQIYVAEDQQYLVAGDANAIRARAESISRQLSGWIKALQAPDAPRGPRFHKEPARANRRWEALKDRFVILPNGSWVERDDGKGKTEDGVDDGRGKPEDGIGDGRGKPEDGIGDGKGKTE